MKKGTVSFCSIALALLVAVLVANIPHTAQAALPHPSNAHILGTRQHQAQAHRRDQGSNLLYGGGQVMTGTQRVYAIFWEPGGSQVSPTYNNLLLQYFNDVGSFGLYHNNLQYTDSSSHAPLAVNFIGSWLDTSAYPSTTLSDQQVQQEVTRALSRNNWKPSIHTVFFVYTARGENICLDSQTCSFTSFCAYHGFFGSNTIYAAMPYTGTNPTACGVDQKPNQDNDADSGINITSHEQMEAATDPLLNAWSDSSGEEIGDKCAWTFGPTNVQQGDVVWHHHPYMVQQEWDNHVSGCVLRGP